MFRLQNFPEKRIQVIDLYGTHPFNLGENRAEVSNSGRQHHEYAQIQANLLIHSRLQFVLNWAVQIAMADVRQQNQTKLSGTLSPPIRIVRVVDRPKFA
jgi:hypothetical protein